MANECTAMGRYASHPGESAQDQGRSHGNGRRPWQARGLGLLGRMMLFAVKRWLRRIGTRPRSFWLWVIGGVAAVLLGAMVLVWWRSGETTVATLAAVLAAG